jgi:hypothetical protein
LELYFVEHVKKVPKNGAVDDYFVNLCKFAVDHGELTRVQSVLNRIISHTNNKRPEISGFLATTYKDQGFVSGAYKNFFKCRKEQEIIKMLELTMPSGYQSEQDLFVTRACLDMLLRSKDLAKTRAIRENFSGVKDSSGAPSPLLNFLDFLIEAIDLGEFDLVNQMANQDFKQALARDYVLYDKVDTICKKYFDGRSIKPENPMQKMLQQMMGGGMK